MMLRTLLTALCTAALLLTAAGCTSDEDRLENFRRELEAGNLTQAEQTLASIGSTRVKEQGAVLLIRTYLSVNQLDRAVYVYDNITTRHIGRDNLDDTFTSADNYDRVVSQLLREYMVSHGEYDRAWRYYPLKYSSENNYGNAASRLSYLLDVVNDMCLKGRADAARKFADVQTSWFAVNVDNIIGEYPEYEGFSSENVRRKLYEQIERLSY